MLGAGRSEQREAQKSWWELVKHSLVGPANRGLLAAAHGWTTLGAWESAGPASKAGEVVKADPGLVLLSGVQLRDLTDHVFEESWTMYRWWALVLSSDLDEGMEHEGKHSSTAWIGNKFHVVNKVHYKPASLRPRPRPFPVMTTISISSWGISETFWRKAFSRASAIKTMSSPGCRGRQTLSEQAEKDPWLFMLRMTPQCWCYLVVYVAVGKHSVEVLDTFLGIPVVTVLKPFLDCSHVHRIFDNCVVVLWRLHKSSSQWHL